MINFESYNPTRIIFGSDTQHLVGENTAVYSKKVLLHYGGKSIKATGTYDAVVASLHKAGVDFVELGGVQPNPRLSLVQTGIALCRAENINFILAVGGGSVIDSAKAIAAGVPYEGNVWDFYLGKATPKTMLGVGVLLTIPAAGSESSDGTVLTDEQGPYKRSFGSGLCYPKFAILNPELCYTLPENQIAAGGADILAHVMERYFSPTPSTELSDRLCEGTMKTLINNMPVVCKDRENYDAWAQVMWAGTVAHNGLLGKGNQEDWASHEIEHELSALYDIAHGAGLAIVFPAWMKYTYKEHLEKFVRFGVEVFGISGQLPHETIAELAIEHLTSFFKSMGLAVTLTEIGIDGSRFADMSQTACKGGTLGSFMKLTPADVEMIYRLAQ